MKISLFQGPSKEQESKWNDIKDQCAQELKLSPEDTAKLKTGDLPSVNPSIEVILIK